MNALLKQAFSRAQSNNGDLEEFDIVINTTTGKIKTATVNPDIELQNKSTPTPSRETIEDNAQPQSNLVIESHGLEIGTNVTTTNDTEIVDSPDWKNLSSSDFLSELKKCFQQYESAQKKPDIDEINKQFQNLTAAAERLASKVKEIKQNASLSGSRLKVEVVRALTTTLSVIESIKHPSFVSLNHDITSILDAEKQNYSTNTDLLKKATSSFNILNDGMRKLMADPALLKKPTNVESAQQTLLHINEVLSDISKCSDDTIKNASIAQQLKLAASEFENMLDELTAPKNEVENINKSVKNNHQPDETITGDTIAEIHSKNSSEVTASSNFSHAFEQEEDIANCDGIAHIEQPAVSRSTNRAFNSISGRNESNSWFIPKNETPIHLLANVERTKMIKRSVFPRDWHVGVNVTEQYCEHVLRLNGSIKDYGNLLNFTGNNNRTNAKMAVKFAREAGWNTLAIWGNKQFQSEVEKIAGKYQIDVIRVDPRIILDKSSAKPEVTETLSQPKSQPNCNEQSLKGLSDTLELQVRMNP